ncbi:MAG: M66 family metalloprotease [Nannocystales bacterium]
MRSGLLLFSSMFLAAACGDDGGAMEASGTGGVTGASGNSDTESLMETESQSGSATDSATSGVDTSGGVMPVDEPARGISISRVEANSGVAIPIAIDGAWADGSQRNAQIPKNRNTAFRVYLDVDDDVWVQREIEARMTLFQADGTEKEYVERGLIAQDSSTSSFQSNIVIGVLAEDMVPNAQFNVELYEVGGGYEGLPEVSEAPKAMPEPNYIGIESTYQNMRIMIVPIEYDFGGCQTQFDTSEEALAPYIDHMFQQNALENIDVEIHDLYRVDNLDLTGNGFFQLLNVMAQLRAAEAPDPNVYYYGLFDNCGECIGDGSGCTLGVANGIPGNSMGEAGARVAIGSQYLGNDEIGIETFVHEIGHNQGRRHIFCSGANAAGTDPSYPYDDGKTSGWGFGVRDFQLRNGNTHFDYMSYCNPTWVSDWQWKETFARIQTLSSWEGADMQDAMEGRYVLMGSVNTETGEASWWTDRGWVEPEDAAPNYRIRYSFDDASTDETLLVDSDPWSEGPWITVRAPLPSDFAAVTGIQLDTPTLTANAPRNEIQAFHLDSFQAP